MKGVVLFYKSVFFCLILISASCGGKNNSTESVDRDTLNGSVNYNDPLQRDTAHVDSSFRNGLGH
jgi:hypothetical protein